MRRVPYSEKRFYRRRAKKQVAVIVRARQAASVARVFLDGYRKDDDGRIAGFSPSVARRILNQSMERVARMTEQERRGYARLAPVPDSPTPQRRALDLRIAGKPYVEIADELGEDEAIVQQWVCRLLERTIGEEVRSSEVARQLHLERLDALMVAQWRKATIEGNVNAAQTVLKIMERQSKLLGLDAPIKVDMEHRIRELAVAEGLDPDEAVEEARAIIKRLPPAN